MTEPRRSMFLLELRLATPLHTLDLPPPLETYASNHELHSVGDLIAIPLSELQGVRGIGKRNLQLARQVVEQFLGCTWDEAQTARNQLPPPSEESIATRAEAHASSLAQELLARYAPATSGPAPIRLLPRGPRRRRG